MTQFVFSSLTNGQHLSFDSSLDTLKFTSVSDTASSVRLLASGANLNFTYAGKTIWLDTTAIGQLSIDTIASTVFANGSFLAIGDGTNYQLADWYGQQYTLQTTTVGQQVWGLGGADIVSTGSGADWLVGNVALTSLNHDSRVGATGSPTGSYRPSISADGTFVAFEGGWTGFGSTGNISQDVIVKNVLTSTFNNEHENSAGTNGGSGSGRPTISADGSEVAFRSSSSNLVSGPLSGALYDIYVSQVGGTGIERVSTGAGGTLAANGSANNPDLSGDGRYVAFESTTSNWASGGSTATTDIFVKDRDTGVLTRVSTSLTGGDGNRESINAKISADGRFVVFESAASNLTVGDTNGYTDIFVWDRDDSSLTNLSSLMTPINFPNNSCTVADIAADGAYGWVIVFQTAKGLVAEDTSSATDIYAFNFADSSFQLVSAKADGTGVALGSEDASVSGDGRFVVFTSGSGQLVAGDTNGTSDIFVKDLQNGQIALVSKSAAGVAANGPSIHAQISLGGEWIVFESSATNLALTDSNGTGVDVFRVANPLLKDTLEGGAGNDTYVINRNDMIIENSGAGTDTVRSSISYTLGANLENLMLTATAAINGTGNVLNNVISVNAGAYVNVIDGSTGTDTLSYQYATTTGATGITLNLGGTPDASGYVIASGISGADKVKGIENITGSNYADTLTGNAGANVLNGLSGNDTMVGGAGNDTLTGGAGADSQNGDLGLDTLIINAVVGTSSDSARVVVTNTSTSQNNDKGQDTLTSFNLTEDTIKVVATNVSQFAHGTDTAIGRAGTDVAGERTSFTTTTGLIGLNQTTNNNWGDAGDIALNFVTPTGTWSESAFEARLQYTLTGTVAIDTLQGGVLNDVLDGGSGNDILIGSYGNDLLIGGVGTDRLIGGIGNDTYVIDVVTDVVIEGSGAPAGTDTDTIQSTITYSLVDTDGAELNGGNVENLTLTGSAAINGTGNTLNNVITGNIGVNTLIGDAGADTLNGGAGNDTLIGGAGADNLNGDTGLDTLVINAVDGTSSDSGRVVTTGTGNDRGQDTLTSFSLTEDTFKVVASNVSSFAHATDTAIGTAGGTDNTGAKTDFTTATGLIDLGHNSNWGNAGDIAVTFSNPSVALTEANFEARLQYILTGTSAANILTGGALSDWLKGGGGNDTLDGGVGSDTADYSDKTLALVATLNGATAVSVSAGGVAEDSIKNIENLTGGTGNDVFTGDTLANTLNGNAGNDMLNGGLGNDLLTGSSGTDVFVFNTALNAITNKDTITDFNVTDDAIRLENAIFAKLTTTVALNADFFSSYASTSTAAPVTANYGSDGGDSYILYNTTTGTLYYDADGTGTASSAVQFALIGTTTHAALTAADFTVI